MLENVFHGVIGGLAYAFSGTANKPKEEKFDYIRFFSTVLVSAVVGGIAGFLKLDYGMMANSSMAAGITVVLEKFFKAGYRKIN